MSATSHRFCVKKCAASIEMMSVALLHLDDLGLEVAANHLSHALELSKTALEAAPLLGQSTNPFRLVD